MIGIMISQGKSSSSQSSSEVPPEAKIQAGSTRKEESSGDGRCKIIEDNLRKMPCLLEVLPWRS